MSHVVEDVVEIANEAREQGRREAAKAHARMVLEAMADIHGPGPFTEIGVLERLRALAQAIEKGGER